MRRLAAVALLVPLLAGCSSDQDDYCDAVQSHQKDLSEIVGSSEPDALLQALDAFHDLQDKAPRDIKDEWQQVVTTLEALQHALDDAGVDPSTYDRDDPPAGAERRAEGRHRRGLEGARQRHHRARPPGS